MKYKEILRLKEMLKKANIPFSFRTVYSGYQVGYPVLPPDTDCICSVIEHAFSYGEEKDRLEIMGLLTDEESKDDTVLGYLIAENVFERIKKDYGSRKEF